MIIKVTPDTVATLDAQVIADLNELGVLSGIAQELSGPITSFEKLQASAITPDQQHHLLLYIDDHTNKALGFAKYGYKNLYFYRKNGSMLQCTPPCLLDFYVSESLQRRGIGLQLFTSVLAELNIDPHLIAYDRPSPKLLSFVKKHFALSMPDLQPNRYCVFEGFLV